MKQLKLWLKNSKVEIVEKKQRRLEARIDDPWKLPGVVKSLLEAYPRGIYLSAITAIDLPEEDSIELDYMFWIIPEKSLLTLKTRVPRNQPRAPSLALLLPAAVPYEQEVYDLFGVVFEGNENLRLGFLTPPDSAGEYPLRRDWNKR